MPSALTCSLFVAVSKVEPSVSTARPVAVTIRLPTAATAFNLTLEHYRHLLSMNYRQQLRLLYFGLVKPAPPEITPALENCTQSMAVVPSVFHQHLIYKTQPVSARVVPSSIKTKDDGTSIHASISVARDHAPAASNIKAVFSRRG